MLVTCEMFGGPCDGLRMGVPDCVSSVCLPIVHDMSADVFSSAILASMQWKTAKYFRDKSKPGAFVFSS